MRLKTMRTCEFFGARAADESVVVTRLGRYGLRIAAAVRSVIVTLDTTMDRPVLGTTSTICQA